MNPGKFLFTDTVSSIQRLNIVRKNSVFVFCVFTWLFQSTGIFGERDQVSASGGIKAGHSFPRSRRGFFSSLLKKKSITCCMFCDLKIIKIS